MQGWSRRKEWGSKGGSWASHPAHLFGIGLCRRWRSRASKRELSGAGCLCSLLSKRKASLGLGRCAGSKASRRSSAGLLPKAEAAGRLPNCAASGLLLWATKHTAGRLLLRLGRSKSKPAGRLRLRGPKGKRATGGLLLLLLLLLLRWVASEAAKPAGRLLR